MSLPTLKTRRLVLRPMRDSDAEAIASLGGRNFDVARWLTGCSWPYDEGEAQAYVSHLLAHDPMEHEAAFAITLGGVFIGAISMEAPGDLPEQPECPTIGYWLGTSFQGFGYSKEAALAVLDWAFDAYGCEAIAARAYEDNSVSRGLLRSLGFKPVGMTTRFAKPLGHDVSCIVVRLDKKTFKAKAAA
ncbi:MAG: GNAT family N-acetyltransferase [Rhodobacteraceae bacterium]|nr:GNAT family N-acetyltransferase [Paracoccaceae bacterium]